MSKFIILSVSNITGKKSQLWKKQNDVSRYQTSREYHLMCLKSSLWKASNCDVAMLKTCCIISSHCNKNLIKYGDFINICSALIFMDFVVWVMNIIKNFIEVRNWTKNCFVFNTVLYPWNQITENWCPQIRIK